MRLGIGKGKVVLEGTITRTRPDVFEWPLQLSWSRNTTESSILLLLDSAPQHQEASHFREMGPLLQPRGEAPACCLTAHTEGLSANVLSAARFQYEAQMEPMQTRQKKGPTNPLHTWRWAAGQAVQPPTRGLLRGAPAAGRGEQWDSNAGGSQWAHLAALWRRFKPAPDVSAHSDHWSHTTLLATGVATEKALTRMIQPTHRSFKTGKEELSSHFKG